MVWNSTFQTNVPEEICRQHVNEVPTGGEEEITPTPGTGSAVWFYLSRILTSKVVELHKEKKETGDGKKEDTCEC